MNITEVPGGPFLRQLPSIINTRWNRAFPAWITAAGLTAVLVVSIMTGAAASSMTVTDSLGRTISLDLPIRKIVALNSDTLEVLRTLDAEELVVGVISEIGRDPGFWESLAGKTPVGSWRDPDIEAIAALQPDLVIAYGRNPGSSLEERLGFFGIQVLRFDFYKIKTLEKEVAVLGELLGREKEARRFCEWHHRYLEMIKKGVPTDARHPTVYIESYSDYHAAGPGSGGDQMCVMAGGRNAAEGFDIPYPLVTPEWVMVQNIDVIVKAASCSDGCNVTVATLNHRRDVVMNRPGWNRIPAVRAGDVYVMESSIWTGPRAVIGIAFMAKWFHSGLFPDLDPGAMNREYLESFQGVSCQGTFVSNKGAKDIK